MGFSLDDRRSLIDDLDRRFSNGIADRAAAADADGCLPPENWRDVIDSGYLRVFHPAEIGGLGADGVTQAMAMETLARACPNTYWSATMSALVGGKLIHTYGNLADHRRLLDPLLSGERLACFAVVERTSGSDAGTYVTTARRDGDGYVLSGEKTRVANATDADLAVVMARLNGVENGWCFAFVDLRQERVRTYPMPGMGLRAMSWGGLVFDEARVDARDVVPVRLDEYPKGVSWGWLFMSIAAIAIAESALEASIEHAGTQIAFGRPLAHMEGVQAALAEMRTEIDAARLLAHRCAWHRGEGRLVLELVGMLKAYASEMAVRVTQHAVQIHGSWGLTPGHKVERLYRDAPMNVIGGFASNRLRELVAQELGLSVTYQEFDWLSPTGLARDSGEHLATSLVTE
ncbi:acyl-CoA dehydrogenase family protein [Saccharopolyspora spinosa]|uniref:Alkylation response protein AidB-like acyl-CoA dehydrogenase n=1 Tax=Saccharopolyspora spinosa TaxID=60894 RepID=A0A2N3Y048_SACSN|nr:acyl-CoA dehydrogenase family protein [Saccharopolyspora spinosa]PKW16289.1 alkylation response protein AidB-like acyl-CoA dehydrogenase [Saccharopolyspora spinosa]